MKQKTLVDKQKQLFKLYFDNDEVEKDGIDIKKVVHGIGEYHTKWNEFFNILKISCPELPRNNSIEKIEIVNYQDVDYLIIKFYSWTYLCIDLEHRKQINFKNGLYPFTEKFFMTNFSEDKARYAPDVYYSLDILDVGLSQLVSFVRNNKNLFLTSPYFKYKIVEDDRLMTFLDFSLLSGKLTLYFGDIDMVDDINYIDIDTDLTITNVMNPTGNFNQLKKMSTKIKDIKIPSNIIPKFLLESIMFQ